jgi:hypothetical protein
LSWLPKATHLAQAMGQRDEDASNQDEDEKVVEVGTAIPTAEAERPSMRLGRLDH